MKFLFITYCFGRSWGESLIGVYKRGLRIALALHERGHEIVFFCGGRENFHDRMTARAEELFQFVDDPFTHLIEEDDEETRRQGLAGIREIAPDIVVIGEAPLQGILLETALATAELRIPMVCIDNAYAPELVDAFCVHHGPLFDALILSGPSSFFSADPPPYLHQVPLFIESDPAAARRMVQHELNLSGQRLMIVIAYEEKVERLGFSLIEKLEDPNLEVIFLSHVADSCQELLDQLPQELRAGIRVIAPQPDPVHFGLLEISRLAVGKCGFMQIAECLSLRTPILTYLPPGGFDLDHLPQACDAFAEVTRRAEAGPGVVVTARRFLELDPASMPAFHQGGLDAAAKTAQILETISRQPRPGITAQAASSGLTEPRLRTTLKALHPGEEIEILWTRLDTVRVFSEDHGIGFEEKGMLALCAYRASDVERIERFWIHTFPTAEMTRHHAKQEAEEIAAAKMAGTPLHQTRRQIYHVSTEGRYVIEHYTGNDQLPPF